MKAAVATTLELAPEDLEPITPETTLELGPEDLMPCPESTLELSSRELLPFRSRRGITLTLRTKEPRTRLMRAEALEPLRAQARSSSRERARALQGRRRRTRRAFFANVRALPLDGRDRVAQGVTADISKEGVFIHAATQPAIDSFVVLKIYAQRGRYSGLARVVHRLEGVGFGCRFVDVDLDQRQTLDTLITE